MTVEQQRAAIQEAADLMVRVLTSAEVHRLYGNEAAHFLDASVAVYSARDAVRTLDPRDVEPDTFAKWRAVPPSSGGAVVVPIDPESRAAMLTAGDHCSMLKVARNRVARLLLLTLEAEREGLPHITVSRSLRAVGELNKAVRAQQAVRRVALPDEVRSVDVETSKLLMRALDLAAQPDEREWIEHLVEDLVRER